MAQVSGDHFVVTVLTAPERSTVLVRLTGEIDMATEPALAGVVESLSATAPSEVVVDLADVTFASSVLPNFLVRAHLALAADSALIVCRPGDNARRLLRTTEVETIVTLRSELPTSGRWAPRNAVRAVAPPTPDGICRPA